jgi:hypothetical protein
MVTTFSIVVERLETIKDCMYYHVIYHVLYRNYQKAHQPIKSWQRFSVLVACTINL